MRTRMAIAALIAGLFVGASATNAAAHHDDHPGRYIESPVSQSPNMHLLSSLDKTSAGPTYRNSDLAFWGRLVFAGNYEGFRIINVADPEAPQLVADVDCPGSQHDVSVWRNLLFLSVDSPRTGPGCDSTATGTTPGFEGIRIFDVSDPANPQFVKGVATDCGSHTHTVMPDPARDRVLLYVSSYPASAFGPTPYGTDCQRLNPDGTQGHSKISVVSVPLGDANGASVVSEPSLDLRDFRATAGYRGCHDITVFVELRKAAAACLSESQIWDLSDLERPRTTARVHNPNVDIWHSAAFTWDGKTVLFGDEAGGGAAPHCRTVDPSTLGAIWFYDLAGLDNQDASTAEPPLGHFKTPRVQGDAANCTMHNFNVIPRTDRQVVVSAAYSAGTSVADFTNPANAREIAHFDPHGANTWSTYFYDGMIYTNDSGRGVDIVRLSDSAVAGAKRFGRLNPQTQESVVR